MNEEKRSTRADCLEFMREEAMVYNKHHKYVR